MGLHVELFLLETHLQGAEFHCKRVLDGEKIYFDWDWRLRVGVAYVNMKNEPVWFAVDERFDDESHEWEEVYRSLQFSRFEAVENCMRWGRT